MNWSDLNLVPAMPEIVLLALLDVVLLTGLWVCDKSRYLTHLMSLGAVIVMAVTQLAAWEQDSADTFYGVYIVDGMSRLAKLVLYAPTFGPSIYSRPYDQDRQIFKSEFHTLSLSALLGMSVMVSATHFLMVYIGLELLSLSLYTMVALHRDSNRSAKTVLKYFMLGALASGLLLYGISMVYGTTGSSNSASVLTPAFNEQANEWLLKLGMVFIVIVIAFKLDTAPFHVWVPDVYDGAPTSATAFMGTTPKVATVVFTFRILVASMGTVHSDWASILAVLAVASLVVGNLAIIIQTNTKRMLAYSTVSHIDFILLAFMAGAVGFTAGLYCAITYALMAAVGFGILMVLSTKGIECENIKDLAGLSQRHTWFTFLMLLSILSMAGIPPLMGFYAKFGMIIVLLEQDHVWLSVFAVIVSLIGAFYYLHVVKVICFGAPDRGQPVGNNYTAKFVLTVNAFLLLLWGIMPQTVIDWCAKALENTL